jgi:hypothetical protein
MTTTTHNQLAELDQPLTDEQLDDLERALSEYSDPVD